MEFNQLIRKWRERSGRTQHQMALDLGYTDGYVAQLERALKLPSDDLVMRLIQVLGLNGEEKADLREAINAARSERSHQRMQKRNQLQADIENRTKLDSEQFKQTAPDLDTPLRSVRNEVPLFTSTIQAIVDEVNQDFLADPDLHMAYKQLKTATSDPKLRPIVLGMLATFAAQAQPRDDP